MLADVLIIVNDGSSPDLHQQHDTVEQVLAELGATEQPRIEVINKCDLGAAAALPFPGAVAVSGKTGEGLEDLQDRIAAELQKTYSPVTFMIPFTNYGLSGQLRPLGRVVSETYTDEGMELTMLLSARDRDAVIARHGSGILKH